jgi:hypothetical protein
MGSEESTALPGPEMVFSSTARRALFRFALKEGMGKGSDTWDKNWVSISLGGEMYDKLFRLGAFFFHESHLGLEWLPP